MPPPAPSQLVMTREALDDLPPFAATQHFHIRSFKPGDEAGWNHVIQASFGGAYDFNRLMKTDSAFDPRRIILAVSGSHILATASAWHRITDDEHTGYLYMVGALPQHKGKGMGHAVSLACLHHFTREGRFRATLQTEDFRLPAIQIYLRLGFAPSITDATHAQRWQKVFIALRQPLLIESFEHLLAYHPITIVPPAPDKNRGTTQNFHTGFASPPISNSSR